MNIYLRLKMPWLLMILMIALSGVCGCKNWEYDVVKHGIHFEKMRRSAKGNIIGFMTENMVIQGFPCEKGWIHFRNGWQLLSFQLSSDYMYKRTLLPAHTWVHFPHHTDRTGYICAFPYDYQVQGYVCGGSGGYKGTQTGFFDSGRLKSFFPPADVVVASVPCESTLLVNVILYENGGIKSCELADDYKTDGKLFKKGTTIRFEKSDRARH